MFLLGILLFSPPFLLIFDNFSTVLGFPVLFLYLFVAWAVLIVLLAIVIEHTEGEPKADAERPAGKSDDAVRGL